mmetsp:Transcript_18809/g.25927  ORF Transcript_18809/g.25927 Transcript_18809/m.25927 type:complete len:124 (+) Transcript_18809:1068-1439(+)
MFPKSEKNGTILMGNNLKQSRQWVTGLQLKLFVKNITFSSKRGMLDEHISMNYFFFQCEQCQKRVKTEVGLKRHKAANACANYIAKVHKLKNQASPVKGMIPSVKEENTKEKVSAKKRHDRSK